MVTCISTLDPKNECLRGVQGLVPLPLLDLVRQQRQALGLLLLWALQSHLAAAALVLRPHSQVRVQLHVSSSPVLMNPGKLSSYVCVIVAAGFGGFASQATQPNPFGAAAQSVGGGGFAAAAQQQGGFGAFGGGAGGFNAFGSGTPKPSGNTANSPMWQMRK